MTYSRPFRHPLPPSVELIQGTAHRPFHFFAPTTAKLSHRHARDKQAQWNSRSHRKRRYLAMSPRDGRPRHAHGAWARIARMSRLEYWNISWWVAILFTAGSIVWVVNGFQAFLPLITSVSPDPVGSGWSAWVGATIFAVGSMLLVLEAWNKDDTANFGHAIERALQGHRQRKVEESFSGEDANGTGDENLRAGTGSKPHWVWWSTNRRYWYEIGFVAAFFQLCGATIFWISGFTGISQILDVLQRHKAALDGVFWTPQVIGGSGFIISSSLYMLETQTKWYIPAPTSLGWHIGFWNFIGGVGFTLCGAFGYSTQSGLMYQSALSTFWGSWAFLIGSVMQWYEAVNTHQEVGAVNDILSS